LLHELSPFNILIRYHSSRNIQMAELTCLSGDEQTLAKDENENEETEESEETGLSSPEDDQGEEDDATDEAEQEQDEQDLAADDEAGENIEQGDAASAQAQPSASKTVKQNTPKGRRATPKKSGLGTTTTKPKSNGGHAVESATPRKRGRPPKTAQATPKAAALPLKRKRNTAGSGRPARTAAKTAQVSMAEQSVSSLRYSNAMRKLT
jgi:hypothetical protein